MSNQRSKQKPLIMVCAVLLSSAAFWAALLFWIFSSAATVGQAVLIALVAACFVLVAVFAHTWLLGKVCKQQMQDNESV